MEKPALCPELQVFMSQFAKFRNRYLTLKNKCTAQDELIEFQKMEFKKLNSYVDQLGTALINSRTSYKVKLRSLKMQIQQLQIDAATSREQFDDMLEDRRNVDEHIRSLQNDVTAMRLEIDLKNTRHREKIELLKEQHNEVLNLYKKKLADLEQRHNNDITCCTKKIMEATTTVGKKTPTTTNPASYTHPAFEDSPKNRKKTAPTTSRWPQLEFADKKKMTTTQESALQRRKKKLYHADNEMIVDLTL